MWAGAPGCSSAAGCCWGGWRMRPGESRPPEEIRSPLGGDRNLRAGNSNPRAGEASCRCSRRRVASADAITAESSPVGEHGAPPPISSSPTPATNPDAAASATGRATAPTPSPVNPGCAVSQRRSIGPSANVTFGCFSLIGLMTPPRLSLLPLVCSWEDRPTGASSSAPCACIPSS